MRERGAIAIPGLLMVGILIVLTGLAVWLVVANAEPEPRLGPIVLAVVIAVVVAIASTGFVVIQPNQAAVVVFLGTYLGTVKASGFQWTWPLTERRIVSLRVQNFDSSMLKVNDATGNPVEVAAVIVWRVVDTAKATFDVQDYEDFVKIQTETAVRHMTSIYPYDAYEPGVASLRANADQVMASLRAELDAQLAPAGVEVLKAQLRRLAYAPEIASDMLRRQQAEAVVAARERIVEGAVGMVDMALRKLSEGHIVELDEERKAQMVSNLLVVLCGESRAQPIVNAGSLYQ